MAKIPKFNTAFVYDVKFVSYRKGIMARFARWIHKHSKNKLAYRLGYEEIPQLTEPQFIGTAMNDAKKGEVLKIEIPKASFTMDYYPHKWNEN